MSSGVGEHMEQIVGLLVCCSRLQRYVGEESGFTESQREMLHEGACTTFRQDLNRLHFDLLFTAFRLSAFLYLSLLRTPTETTKYYHLHSSPTLSFAHTIGNSKLFSTVKCNEISASPPAHPSAFCITGSYGSGTEMRSRCKITSYSSR